MIRVDRLLRSGRLVFLLLKILNVWFRYLYLHGNNSLVRYISERFLTFSWLGTTLAILFFGLWPFEYPIPNRVTALSEPPEIRFMGGKGRAKLNAGGVVYTPEPLTIQRVNWNAPNGSMTLVFKAEAASEFTSGVGTIVAFCDEENSLKLLFGQWRSHLIIRTFFFANDKRGPYTEIGVRDVLSPGKVVLISVTSGLTGTTIYQDGELARSIAEVRLLPEGTDFSGYKIYLGNEPEVRAPWEGEIYGLELYDRTLTADEVYQRYRSWTNNQFKFANPDANAVVKYTFTNVKGMKVSNALNDLNGLLIPKRFDLKQRALEPLIGYEIDAEDVIVNILGFIPFGFFSMLCLRQRKRGPIAGIAVVVLLTGFAISFGIEVAQAYMPTRNSSLIDLITNFSGTLFGVVAACLMEKRQV